MLPVKSIDLSFNFFEISEEHENYAIFSYLNASVRCICYTRQAQIGNVHEKKTWKLHIDSIKK
jgi:hypothetical protein